MHFYIHLHRHKYRKGKLQVNCKILEHDELKIEVPNYFTNEKRQNNKLTIIIIIINNDR